MVEDLFTANGGPLNEQRFTAINVGHRTSQRTIRDKRPSLVKNDGRMLQSYQYQ